MTSFVGEKAKMPSSLVGKVLVRAPLYGLIPQKMGPEDDHFSKRSGFLRTKASWNYPKQNLNNLGLRRDLVQEPTTLSSRVSVFP
jgi:hypothetical protein